MAILMIFQLQWRIKLKKKNYGIFNDGVYYDDVLYDGVFYDGVY